MRLIFVCVALASACTAQKLGQIQNFQQKSNGDDYIELEWQMTQDGDLTVHKYTLTTDADFSNDVRCPAEHCTLVVDYLLPCTVHSFELVPHFDGPSGEVLGDTAYTDGNTADKPPGAPSNVVVTGDDAAGTHLGWTQPTVNPDCVDEYEVCVWLSGQPANCYNVNDTTVVVPGMSACAQYQVSVSGMTPSGDKGDQVTATITTKDGVPGAPQNVATGLTTVDSIEIKWDDPMSNPLCVDRFAFSIGETHSRSLHYVSALDHDHVATIQPLIGCTNYTIDVFAVNKAGLYGTPVRQYTATAETEPMPPPSVVVGAHGPGSIDVIWGGNPSERCAGSITICWHDQFVPEEICEDIPTGGGGGGGSGGGGIGGGNYTITSLNPCSVYDISVSVVTPGGIIGHPSGNATSTEDVKPGPVRNLDVKTVAATELTISYEPPETNPQCVREYDFDVINEDETRGARRGGAVSYMDGTFTGLEACANYLVMVRAVSPKGLRSDWRNTKTKTGSAVPSAPRNLEAWEMYETAITLNWWQSEVNKFCAEKYTLTWDGGSTEVTPSPGELLPFEVRYEVTGLTACTSYTFTVIASTNDGKTSDPTTITASTTC